MGSLRNSVPRSFDSSKEVAQMDLPCLLSTAQASVCTVQNQPCRARKELVQVAAASLHPLLAACGMMVSQKPKLHSTTMLEHSIMQVCVCVVSVYM